MELDKQQLKRLRERHHRRHGIRPAHSEAAEQASRFLKQAFNIREGRAPYHVIRKRFVNGARLTGSHLCILIIAMLIASIGLDIDSDIAIVGAMLICPLMGSVLAMAYGVATLDREITVEAVAGLALQMVFCLVTSTLYFKLSPLGATTAAIIDNSTPTVWDLAVALAGGFAGGLGNSRDQEPATLIAGVAVATALMPPLCAAGYGIAIASGSLFLSALYEFGINVVFIALAAEAVLLLLRVPLKRDLNGDGIVTAEENAEVDALSRKVRRRIIVGTVVFAIPCIVMTAGSIGSAQAGVQDGYGVTETTRELAAVLPGFKDYTVAVETSATEGEEGGHRRARDCRPCDDRRGAWGTRPSRRPQAHRPQCPRARSRGVRCEVIPARDECAHGRKLRRDADAIRTRANSGVQFTRAPLAHMTQSAVKSHNGPADRLQSVGGACR